MARKVIRVLDLMKDRYRREAVDNGECVPNN